MAHMLFYGIDGAYGAWIVFVCKPLFLTVVYFWYKQMSLVLLFCAACAMPRYMTGVNQIGSGPEGCDLNKPPLSRGRKKTDIFSRKS